MKQHEVGLHRVAATSPSASQTVTTSVASASKTSKSVVNSVPAKVTRAQPLEPHHPHQQQQAGQKQTVTVTDLASSSSNTTDIAVQQVKQGRSYQYMPDSSDSDSDDILSVSCHLFGECYAICKLPSVGC